MLPRVLEPELMDSVEEAGAYDAMDHSAVNKIFADDFLGIWNGAGPVLDVGTGTAQIPVVLCQRHPTIEIVALDSAGEMLKLASANIARAGLQGRVRAERADAKRMSFVDGTFGAVISNSIIHHIPEPMLVLREMVRVVRPGGWLFIRDLLRPDDDSEVRRLVQAYAGDASAYQQQLFEASLRAALTLEEIRALVSELGLSSDSVKQTTDRHWTWSTQRLSA